MSQTKDFFVSYTRVDREWAEWVAWELQEAGYTCRARVKICILTCENASLETTRETMQTRFLNYDLFASKRFLGQSTVSLSVAAPL
jgi:hypothetical protein